MKVHGVRKRPSSWRRLRATWRDTLLLLREFSWPLLLFTVAMIGGGLLYFELALYAGVPVRSRVEAVYLVLGLTFFQPLGDFPQIWYLQIYYFLMPIIGIGVLAQGLADFGSLLFNRRGRSKEWDMAVASMFSNHVVLAGLGHLGFRVAKQLIDMEQDVVVIELNPAESLIERTKALGIPVVPGDGRQEEILHAAAITRAKAVVLCIQNDSLNLQIALKARRLNPNIRIIIRIFEDDFAESLAEQFQFRAMSSTQMATPAFAAAAAGVDMTQPITIEGESFSLASLQVARLVGQSVQQIEQKYDVSVVLLRHQQESDFHPRGDRLLESGDLLAVLGGAEVILRLTEANND